MSLYYTMMHQTAPFESFAKTLPGCQVVNLSALIRTQSQLDDPVVSEKSGGLRPPGGSTAIPRPTAPRIERESPGLTGAPARSTRCPTPDGSAPCGSAPQTRRARAGAAAPRKESGGPGTPR